MAAINFPSSPSNGDTFVVDGVTYTYNSAETKWKTTINSNAFLPLSGGTVSGNIVLGGELQHSGDTDTKIHFDTDTIKLDTGGTTRATVDSSGRVLVGTSSTSQSLTAAFQGVSGSSTAGAVLALSRGLPASSIDAQGYLLGRVTFTDNSQTPYAQIEGISDAAAGTNDYPGRIVLSTTADGASSPTEAMRINNAGSILINTTSGGPGGASVTGRVAILFNPSTHGGLVIASSSGAGSLQQFTNTTFGVVGSITTNGTSTAFNTSSDYRLKENIQYLDGAIDRLKQLSVHRFNFIANSDVTVDGFLAHEVQAVVPEAVTGTKDEVDDEGKPVYQGIDQSKLVPLLTAALQEAIAKIETQDAAIAALETRLAALEATP